jgi:hypothetical protein
MTKNNIFCCLFLIITSGPGLAQVDTLKLSNFNLTLVKKGHYIIDSSTKSKFHKIFADTLNPDLASFYIAISSNRDFFIGLNEYEIYALFENQLKK